MAPWEVTEMGVCKGRIQSAQMPVGLGQFLLWGHVASLASQDSSCLSWELLHVLEEGPAATPVLHHLEMLNALTEEVPT